MPIGVEILLIGMVTAVAAALPGCFLVLRRVSLVGDAISHAILPGIVVAFFITGDLSSPILVLAAAATGVLTVVLIEALHRTGLVAEDAAVGLVFPALFSLGVILISRYASGVHLDTDAVLLGDLAFAPFDRLVVSGVDLGPTSLWTMGGVLALNLLFVVLLYKELKLATLDPGLAALLGFSPGLLHHALMCLVSITAVGAFSAVGSVLVVALMIAPPATAYLLADRLSAMLLLAAAAAAGSAALGERAAVTFDVSIAGGMASAAGLVFAVTFLLAPRRGLLAQARRRARQRVDFRVRMLVVHLLQHEAAGDADRECRTLDLYRHLRWSPSATARVVRAGQERDLVSPAGPLLTLAPSGRRLAEAALVGDPLGN